VHVVVDEVFDIGLARHKPVQLMQDALPVDALGSQGESFGEIKRIRAPNTLYVLLRAFIDLLFTAQRLF